MLEINVNKNDCGLQEAVATLTLPPITVVRAKADRNDLEYELRRAFEEIVGEIAEKQLKSEL